MNFLRNIFIKLGFSNKRDHDLHAQVKRLRDLRGSLEKIMKETSSGIYKLLLTFSLFGAIDFSLKLLQGAANQFQHALPPTIIPKGNRGYKSR